MRIDVAAQRWWHGYGQDGDTPWIAHRLTAKQLAVDGALRVVTIARAASLSRNGKLERPYRDVCSWQFHPPNAHGAHEVIGQAWLGVLGNV